MWIGQGVLFYVVDGPCGHANSLDSVKIPYVVCKSWIVKFLVKDKI
jgi:hypothetical protein